MSPSKIVRYRASAPDAKYLGSNLRVFTENLRSDQIQPILEQFKIKDIVAHEYMDAQLQLDIMREIEMQHSFEELVAVGVKAAELFPLPPEINSIETLLEAAPRIWRVVGQGIAPEETIIVERLGATHYRMIYHLPLPPFVMYGSTYGLMRRVRQKNQIPLIVITTRDTPYIFDIQW